MKRGFQNDHGRRNGSSGAGPWRTDGPPMSLGRGLRLRDFDLESPPRFALKSLLVPLDGTLQAEHAIPHALAIARRSGALVVLTHVHCLLDNLRDPWQAYHDSELAERLKGQKQRYLRSVVRRIGRVDSTPVTAVLIESLNPVESLRKAAGGADLVVMANHGRGLWGKLWHGSVSDALMRRLGCPLLLVRGYNSPVDLTGDPVARHVVIPFDGSALSEAIFDPAAAIGQLSDAELTLLNIQRGKPKGDAESSEIADRMLSAAKRLERHAGEVSPHIVRSSAPVARAIVSQAEQRDADLIALATHGRGGWSRLTQGSVAEEIVRRSRRIPVLLHRPPHEEARSDDA